ncbi:hypothetical protein EYR40_005675 [Pleurotus pulmonarius]|nr:hypothetical protein EYR40_005675 [Pleurotus pulmonarius]
MANPFALPPTPFVFIPLILTGNGMLFQHRHMLSYDPSLSDTPYSCHPEESLLSRLHGFCDFDLLDHIPPSFRIEQEVNYEKWVQLVNPPPHLNKFLIETLFEPISRHAYKFILGVDRLPITADDLIFHPRLGMGLVQGIIRQTRTYVQLLLTFRNHQDKHGIVTFVAAWIHSRHIVVDDALRSAMDTASTSPEFDIGITPSLAIRVSDTEYDVETVHTTD